MRYLVISKTDKKNKMKKKLSLKNGFEFNKSVHITLYNHNMIHYILIKKLNNSLKNLINLYLLYEDDEDARAKELSPKIELLRRVLIEQYAFYLEEVEIESYLDKLNKLEGKVLNSGAKKSRRR